MLIHYTKSIVASSHSILLNSFLQQTVSIIYNVLFSILKYTESNFRSASHISVKNRVQIYLQLRCLQPTAYPQSTIFKSYLGSSFPLPFILVCISLQRFFSIATDSFLVWFQKSELYIKKCLAFPFPLLCSHPPPFHLFSHLILMFSSLFFLFIFTSVSRYMDIFLFPLLFHIKGSTLWTVFCTLLVLLNDISCESLHICVQITPAFKTKFDSSIYLLKPFRGLLWLPGLKAGSSASFRRSFICGAAHLPILTPMVSCSTYSLLQPNQLCTPSAWQSA